MKREKLFSIIKKTYDIEPDYPWKDKNAVIRHKDNKKWFAVVLEVGRDKLGFMESSLTDVLNVKCDPELIGALRMKSDVFPAYHMNKDKWISVLLDGSVSEEEIINLISISYDLTDSKKKKVVNKKSISKNNVIPYED